MSHTLKASVQYDDYVGSAAADDADKGDIRDLLQSKGLLRSNEFVVAVTFYSGIDPSEPHVSALVIDITGFPDVPSKLGSSKIPTLREVNCQVSLLEFFSLFKRFNIVIERKGQSMHGMEYSLDES